MILGREVKVTVGASEQYGLFFGHDDTDWHTKRLWVAVSDPAARSGVRLSSFPADQVEEASE